MTSGATVGKRVGIHNTGLFSRFYASNARGQNQRMDNIGYAVGGGVKYAFTPNLTGKIEGLYVNFGTTGNDCAAYSVVGVTNLGVPVVSPASYGNSRNKDVVSRLSGLV